MGERFNASTRLPLGAIYYMIHHVFLLPKLPQNDDFNFSNESHLLKTVIETLLKFKFYVTAEQKLVVESVVGTIRKLNDLREWADTGGVISEGKLTDTLKDLCKDGGIVSLHIGAQNAGLIFSKCNDSIHIEAFELTPENQHVISTKGRLHRVFPGPAFSLNLQEFEQVALQTTIVQTLAKMSQQRVVGTQPQVRKRGKFQAEYRDTTHPSAVTELFMGFLRSIGHSVDVDRIWKNTREEVLYCDALHAWHRSPMWLLVRVTVQLAFLRLEKESHSSGTLYKSFMVFLLAHMLSLSVEHPLSSDIISSMNSKLAWRLQKFQEPVDGSILGFVHAAMQKAQDVLNARWRSIIKDDGRSYDMFSLKQLDFETDASISLPSLDGYMVSIKERKSDNSSSSFQPTSDVFTFNKEDFPGLHHFTKREYSPYNLEAFEGWVACDLNHWMQANIGSPNTCNSLSELVRTYFGLTSSAYSGNPEANSIMFLTILELWIACDKAACENCGMLRDYDTGIPCGLFECLILPFKSQMKRLFEAEAYINRRKVESRFPASAVLEDYGTASSFSVRYFAQSLVHQNLLARINAAAALSRQEKVAEFNEKKEQYRSLMRLHDQSSCEFNKVEPCSRNNWVEKDHSSTCKKCDYKSQAALLTIRVHEWPLPTNIEEAQSTIFELILPPWFRAWRDITFFLLLDVLQSEYAVDSKPQKKYSLLSYQGLSSYAAAQDTMQIIGLLSGTKPNEITHRRDKKIAVSTLADVCLENGLQYEYYDSKRECFVSRFAQTDELMKSCTYELPSPSRHSLQQFLFRPASNASGPTPNTVISSQSQCPDHMTLEEYKALSSVPLGFRLQWQNILVQIAVPLIDWKKVETQLVILQCMNQTGPPLKDNVLRASHQNLDEESFASSLLKHLEEALQRCKGNWESSQALSTFTSVAARLLSLTSILGVQAQCLTYLAEVRTVAFQWVKLLKSKADCAINEEQREELSTKALEIALICAGSFNVDQIHLTNILSDSKDASILLQCSIIIQEGHRTISADPKALLSILHRRWRSLSYRGYCVLREAVIERRSAFVDDAVRNSWSAYQPGLGWQNVSANTDYWIVSETTTRGNPEARLSVHLNLLTGELLVNGFPLARLPSKYENHPSYTILFGNSGLEVMPTAIPGLQFSGMKEYAGHVVHFGLSSESASSTPEDDLIVQAVKDGRKFEYIPSRVFKGELPTAFVEDYVHWCNIDDGSIEFRPISHPWAASSGNWRLVKQTSEPLWRMEKDENLLVGVKSKTHQMLSAILSPLTDIFRIHNILNTASSSLEIECPKLQLVFQLRLGTSFIQSRQFRGMCIDSDQSLGTLVGLKNKLILRHEKTGHRQVILLEGQVSSSLNSGHVAVIVDKESAIKIHHYQVDEQIGRLVDDGSLQSKLVLCYLHALTSFCLPDPLLYRTGTESALKILKSASVRSFARLSQSNAETLAQIAKLTPGRVYYPPEKCVMQTVSWSSSLGFLAQHGGFYKAVKNLFDQAGEANLFFPTSQTALPELKGVQEALLDRDSFRSCMFRVAEFGAEDKTTKFDREYFGRDRNQNSSPAVRAFSMSSSVYQGHLSLVYPVPYNTQTKLWNFLSETNEIYGSDDSLKLYQLKYDAGLLLDSNEFISQMWCSLHKKFSQERSSISKFDLMIWFATLAFAEKADTVILQALLAFFTIPEMAKVVPLTTRQFYLGQGLRMKENATRNIIQQYLLPLNRCPEKRLRAAASESRGKFLKRQHNEHQENQKSAVDSLVVALKSQWPSQVPVFPTGVVLSTSSQYINVASAIEALKSVWKIWYDNLQFSEYLDRISLALLGQTVSPVPSPSNTLCLPVRQSQIQKPFISVDDVWKNAEPPILPSRPGNLTELLMASTDEANQTPRLSALIECLDIQAESNYARKYTEDLRRSLRSLEEWTKRYSLQLDEIDLRNVLESHLRRCKAYVGQVYEAILSALTHPARVNHSLGPGLDVLTVNMKTKHCPRLTPSFLLQQLARVSWARLPKDWKFVIVQYGIALTDLQRAARLVNLCHSPADVVKELRNSGHSNWNPLENPEALLLEVESGIMIREVQESIANRMRSPPSGKNSVMQLNMGEGKSTVIVPNVAAYLADGTRLVRVIVAKPQSKQMLQMLVSKLGGLLDRRIYHMPFSRALKLGVSEANTIGKMYSECMEHGGILLVQPEHVLSFKLMGLECLITGKESVGRSLLSTQEFFDESSRDIVDESDENFSVKFELIYTMGMQRPIELSPERWICIQQVLELVKTFAHGVKCEHPTSVELHERWPGSFPRIRIFRPEAQQQISACIAERICETGLNGFPIARQPRNARKALLRYITKPCLTPAEIEAVEGGGPDGFWSEFTSGTLLLLRGLIGGGILSFAFGQKRWRVNYGLDIAKEPRTRLAIPYRAKDNPTPRSEFSHPDVVIVLTCLSYYYGGLQDDDLFLAFGHLLKSDQADVEYQGWVKDAPNLPHSFKHLIGINLKDKVQCTEQVFPSLRYAKGAIDYFLSHIVFPKEMKEFPDKLSASGWDIGQIKTHPTTGFSGTNDSRMVLPLSVKHLDLKEQEHTNALVLEYLLQPENTVTFIHPRKSTEASASDASLLLEMVVGMEPSIQVILDVGAQIIELSNMEVAREWLKLLPDHGTVQAVVFFNDNDEICVLDRKGKIEPLQTSSFAKQLDVCRIFLDEAHTRGTDLKLPIHYRAAVTLGPSLTKDRLVQACMRMRQLGHGQSVVFCVPEEVRNKILAQKSDPKDLKISVTDVLSWSISETCIDMQRSMPLWAAQGQRHENQKAVWADASSVSSLNRAGAERFLEKESQSLEERYRPRLSADVTSVVQAGDNENLGLIIERCREFNNLEFNAATLQEEQERELSPEIQAERQIQKPHAAKPANHHIHHDVVKLVTTGVFSNNSKAYMPAFQTLRTTSAAKRLDISQFPEDLYVTADFAATVQISGNAYVSDDFQRPVQWVMTTTTTKDSVQMQSRVMVISPFEAQQLLPKFKDSKVATLHLYSPRPNLGFRPLDGLNLYNVPERPLEYLQSVPRRAIVQLNLFAGQLYLDSFEEYIEVCKCLGLAWQKSEGNTRVAADGFIIKTDKEMGKGDSTFRDSPVRFFKLLMTKIRRNCESIDKTHMGKILDGILLLKNDFEEEVRDKKAGVEPPTLEV